MSLVGRALTAVLLAVVGLGAPAHAQTTYPFQNPKLSLDARVDDLLGRLTLDEKVSLLHQYEPAIPRLGIKAFKTGTEALHGVAWSTDIHNGGAVVTARGTVFPQAVGLASTWNPALIKQVGSAVGDEARGYHTIDPDVWGLQLWAPVVNLLRDPRWGRNEEGYSEDPYLTGAISTAYGSGIEGPDPDHLRAAPVLKHYLANNNEANRDTTSSDLRPRVENEYDQKAFSAAISADAATGVMASYNLVNGRPDTVDPDLNDVVRKWTGRDLLNVSDAGAPNNLVGSEKYYPTLAAGDAAALKAGLDSFTTDDTNAGPTTTAVKEALSTGLLKESDVDTAVRHILSIRVRLGDFDPDGGPYAGIGADVIDSPAHRKLARQTADQAAVLLKNSGHALPLSARTGTKVAVVGPLENTLYTDWYSAALPYTVTPLAGIRERLGSAGTVTDSEGADRIALKDVGTGKYITAGTGASGAALKESATSADSTTQFDVFDWGQGKLTLRSVANGRYAGRHDWGDTIVNDQAQPNGWYVQQMFTLEKQDDGGYLLRYAGYETDESWYGDKKYLKAGADGTLVLATKDEASHFSKDLIASGTDQAVKAAKGADAAVVVVGSMPFINGREAHDRTTMALAESQENLIKAVRAANPHTIVVVENSYPTTLNWEQANVPGILWTTHAGAETGHAIADTLFGDSDPAGRLTQTWYRSDGDLPDILDYDIIKSDRTYQYYRGTPLYPFGHGLSYTTFRYDDLRVSAAGGRVTATVRVTNTGRRAGDEVVQLYTHQRTSRDKEPARQLRAFQRVRLNAGRSTTVRLTFNTSDLAHWDVTRDRNVVETSAYDVLVGASSADIRQRAALRLNGETIPARDLTRTTRAVDFDDYRGVRLVDETKERGDAVGAADGDWLRFADVSLGAGAATFTGSAASAGSGSIEVHLDSPAGPLAGTATVGGTGDVYEYATTTAALHGAKGRHDVYLVFHGDLRLSTFSLRGAG
ncbi:glycoside hydrolase family 3 C-terminal domain-containing protein [Actinoallomurus iriomotensis]|uniref:Exo-alpha-(1->6)-L-arabinopyranosidase n=1 Tax=Actinoallomurus iriomotensis TaxID=478107 RepID=A0A9W6RT34_9ACTN|nr:glycoside hydrolase family 3 C-terminal domain-containing protein [Actinoallomurus iriomotensis]GLY79420.1 beta-glucosidase [Actinoallomurus iriomotensis]